MCRGKKSTILVLALLLLIFTPAGVMGLDNPHGPANTIDCGSCHWTAGGSKPVWMTQPISGKDDTPKNFLCLECHDVPVGNVTAATVHSSAQTSNQYWQSKGGWSTECVVCHHPHSQRQTTYWKSPSFLLSTKKTFTMTPSGGNTIINFTGYTLPVSPDFQYYYFMPDNRYYYYYKILTATPGASSITVQGNVLTSFVKSGYTFAIVYGKNIKEYFNYKAPNNAYQKGYVKIYNSAGPFSATDKNNPATSVCMMCHTQTKYFRKVPVADNYHETGAGWTNGRRCFDEASGCHKTHEEGFKRSGACGTCHGMPPSYYNSPSDHNLSLYMKVGGVFIGNATGVTQAGAHVKHGSSTIQTFSKRGVGCYECHNTGMYNPPDSDPDVGDLIIQLGFNSTTVLYKGGKYNGRTTLINGFTYGGPGHNLNDNSLQCSNVYCHGGTIGATPPYPAWTGSVVCGNCHKATAADPLTLGSHVKHAGNASTMQNRIVCYNCHGHGGTGAVKHVDGYASWVLNTTAPTSGGLGTGAKYMGVAVGSNSPVPTPTPNYGNCDNFYCHSNANPSAWGGSNQFKKIKWGSSAVGCSDCHSMPSTATPNWSAVHTKHVKDGQYPYTCDACHTTVAGATNSSIENKALHLDGLKQVSFSVTYGGTWSTSSPNCANSYCHSDGGNYAGTMAYKTANWTGTLSCDKCHGDGAGVKVTTDRHPKHVSDYTYKCYECHSSVVNSSDAVSNKALHVDKSKQVAWGTIAAGASAYARPNCSNNYCHSDGGNYAGTKAYVTAAWNNATPFAGCDDCHGNGAGVKVSTDRHPKHLTNYNYKCYECHSSVVNSSDAVSNKALHVDGLKQVAWGTLAAGSGAYSRPTCATNYCHSDGGNYAGTKSYGSPAWNDTNPFGCDDCHGDGAGVKVLTDRHPKHVTTYPYKCYECHSSVVNSSDAISDYTKHLDGLKQVAWGTIAAGAPAYARPNCSTNYCHSDGGNYAGTKSYVTAAWNNATPFAGCDDCHGNGAGVKVSTDRHPKHVTTYPYKCYECHSSVVNSSDAITAFNLHVDGAKQVAWGTIAAGSGAYARPNCGTNYCHSDGGNYAGTKSYQSAAWNSGTALGCDKCHGDGAGVKVLTDRHPKHVSDYTYKCYECHSSVVNSSDAVTAFALHVDGAKQVAWGTIAAGSGAYARPNCGTNYCHSDGGNYAGTKSYQSAAWNSGTALGCDKCHGDGAGVKVLTDRHPKHVATYAYKCYDCHSTVVNISDAISSKALHVDGLKQVSMGSGTYTRPTCTNVNCHSTGDRMGMAPARVYVSADWNTSSLDCGGCHKKADTGANMTGGSNTMSPAHVKHVATDTNLYYGDTARGANAITCGFCHKNTADNNTTINANGLSTYHVLNQANDVLMDTAKSLVGGSAAWNTPNCSSVYCHSDGKGAFKPVAWTATFSNCGGCHGDSEGRPSVHDGGTCITCHDHVNSGGTGFTSISLHIDGTIQSTGCGGCHGSPPIDAGTLYSNATYGSTGRGTDYTAGWGAHSRHSAKSYGCPTCHKGGKDGGSGQHNSGNPTYINIGFDYLGEEQGYYQAPDFSDADFDLQAYTGTTVNVTGSPGDPRTCSNMYCHSDGGNYAGTRSYKTADWDGTVACDKCHGDGAGVKATTDRHPKHVATYPYKCYECHSSVVNSSDAISNEANHVNGTKQVAWGTIAAGSAAYARPTCSTNYCHSDGGDYAGTKAYVSAAWNNATPFAGCDDCHGNGAGVKVSTDRHPKHVTTYPYKCYECHSSVVNSSDAITAFNLHVDGAKQVAWGTIASGSGAYARPTCGTNYCHSDGGNYAGTKAYQNAAWNNATPFAGCDDCHGNGAGVKVSTDRHPKHVSDYTYNCYECHSSVVNSSDAITAFNLHVDGAKQVAWGTIASGSGAYARPNCGTNYCHSDGGNYAGTKAYVSAAWNNATPFAGCDDCHGNGAGVKVSTDRHPKHVTTYPYKCYECHSSVVDSGDAVSNKALHVDGAKQVAWGTIAAGAAAYSRPDCATNYCHSDGGNYAGTKSYVTAAWNNATPFAGCDDCHGDGAGVKVLTDRHPKHVTTYPYKCYECHSSVVDSGDAVTAFNLHVDGAKQVAWGTIASGSGAYARPNCATNYCHSDGGNYAGTRSYVTAAWNNATPFAGCDDCHGDGAGVKVLTDRHTKHLTNYNYKCYECHSSVVNSSDAVTAFNLHVDGVKQVAWGTLAAGSPAYARPNCATNFCHSDGGNYAGTKSYGSPAWNDSTPYAGCDDCHGDGAGQKVITDRHPKHVATYPYKCYECHSSVVNSSDAITAFNLHIDGLKQVAWGTIASGSGAYARPNCGTNYCHSDGGNYAGTKAYVSAAWNNATPFAGCDDCHGNGAGVKVSTDRHPKHVTTYPYKCYECHSSVVNSSDAITAFNLHVDGAKQVAWGTIASGSGAYARPNCGTNYCHSDGGNYAGTKSYQSAAWNNATPFAGCDDCHGNGAGVKVSTDRHPKHVTTYPYSCYQCHSSVVDSGDAITAFNLHVDGAKQVAWGTIASGSGAYARPNCGTNYCHSDGGNYAGTKAYQSAAWNNATPFAGCDDCHGDGAGVKVLTDRHTKHLTNYNYKCYECHSSVVNSSDAVTAFNLHVDGVKQVAWGTLAAGSPAYARPNCATNFCHSDGGNYAGTKSYGSPAWNDSTPYAGCDDCHGDGAGQKVITDRHPKHVATYPYKCYECHSSVVNSSDAITAFNLHIDGLKQVAWGTIASGSGAYARPNCGTNYCHSDGGNYAGTKAYQSAAWNSGTALGCDKCHGNGAGVKVTTDYHPKHVTTYTYTCFQCHSSVVNSSDAITDFTLHVNGSKQVAWGTGTIAVGSDAYARPNCTNNYCHSKGTAFSAAYGAGNTTPAWNGATINCAGCHDGTGTGPTYGNGSPKANSHNKHVVVWGYTCEKCHYDVTEDGTTVAAAKRAAHVNKAYNILAGGGVSYSYTAGSPGTPSQCTSISCHGNGNAAWGSTTITCTSCHVGTGDAEDYAANLHTNGTTSRLDSTQWTTSGHGRDSGNYSTTTYVNTANPAANLLNTTPASTGTNKCLFCHSTGVNHKVGTNPFRLRYTGNQTCLDCHNTGSPGVDPDGAGSEYGTKNATVKIKSTHYGAIHASARDGGKFCWDCHDPHGDASTFNGTENVKMISATVSKDTEGTYGIPSAAKVTAVFRADKAATDWATDSSPWTKICNTCHTYDAAGVNGVDKGFWSTGSEGNHQGFGGCTGCHKHNPDSGDPNLAFMNEAGEPCSPSACNGCHGEVYTRMNDSYANVAYKHYVNNATATEQVIDRTNLTTDNRRCLMCHVDHDLFSPACNAANTTGRAANVRVDVATLPTMGVAPSQVAAGYTNTDFVNLAGKGGLCLSCHLNQFTKAVQTNNGVQTVPAIPYPEQTAQTRAPLGGVRIVKNSTHNYSVQSGTFSGKSAGDTSRFQAVCLKCHNDTMDPKGGPGSGIQVDASTAKKFGVHQSSKNSFYAVMGTGNFKDFVKGLVTNVAGTTITLDQDLLKDYTGYALFTTNASNQAQRVRVTSTNYAGGAGSDTVTVASWPRYTPVVGTEFEIVKNITPVEENCFNCHSKNTDGFKPGGHPANRDYYDAHDMSDTLVAMYKLFVSFNNGSVDASPAPTNSNNPPWTLWTDLDLAGTWPLDGTNYVGYMVRFKSGPYSGLRLQVIESSTVNNTLKVNKRLTDLAGLPGSRYDILKPATHPLDTAGLHKPDEFLTAAAGWNKGDLGAASADSASGTTITVTDSTKKWGTNAFNGMKLTITQVGSKLGLQGDITGNTANTVTATFAQTVQMLTGESYAIGTRHVSCIDCHNTHAAQIGPSGSGTSLTVNTTSVLDNKKTTDATGWGANKWQWYLLQLKGTNGTMQNIRQIRQITSTSTAVGGTTYNVGVAFTLGTTTTWEYEVVRHTGETGAGGKGVWGVTVSGYTTPAAGSLQTMAAGNYTKKFDTGGDKGGKEYEMCVRCHSFYGFQSSPPTTPSFYTTNETTPRDIFWAATDISAEINPRNAAHHAIVAVGNNQPIFPSGAVVRSDGRASKLSPYWTAFARTTAASNGITSAGVVTITAALPAPVLPGWYVYLGTWATAYNAGAGRTSGWFQITKITSGTVFTIAKTNGNPWDPNASYDGSTPYNSSTVLITPGLGDTFVPPYGPWSVIRCDDCHGSSLLDPLGPHSSTNRWLVKQPDNTLKFEWVSGTSVGPWNVVTVSYGVTTADSTNTNVKNSYNCFNCHRADVYPTSDIAKSTTANPQRAYLSRMRHGNYAGTNPDRGIWTSCGGRPGEDDYNTANSSNKTFWGQYCRHCHGGDKIGGIHGTNVSTSASPNTPLGRRFLNGATWNGVPPTTTTTTAGCYTYGSGNLDVSRCAPGHSNRANISNVVVTYDFW